MKLSDETHARIMLLRACNFSHKTIAGELDIGETTVNRHLRDINREARQTTPEETVEKHLKPLIGIQFK